MAGSEEEGWRVTRDFVLEMVREFKEQKSIHPRFAFEILFQADEVRSGCGARGAFMKGGTPCPLPCRC